MKLCRADKFLLASGAAVLGSAAAFGPSAWSIGAPFAAHAILMIDGIFRPDSSVLYPTIVRGRTDRPHVALTFDDGPDPEVTPRVLDALAEYQARATLFVIGRHLERNRALGERMIREGHELGNHSWHHSPMTNFYSTAGHANAIDSCSQLIQSFTNSPEQPLYRPPVGLKSPALARAATKRNLSVVAWSIHSHDTFAHNAKAVANGVVSRIRPGDIVLLHDGHERDNKHRALILDVAPLILKGLRERGLSSVPVSELLTETQRATRAPSAATLAADDARS